MDKGSCILQKTSCYGQAVSENNLQNGCMYEITCQFNRPLNRCSLIRIGLIQEQHIHSKAPGDNNDINTVFDSCGTGADTIIKGVELNSSPLCLRLSAIRFRFCISTQQLYIFDESR